MRIKARTALSKSSLPGLDYALNPYRGCTYGCVYCYSPDILRMGDEDREWGAFVDEKDGLPNILAKELKRKEKGMIGLGTVTDPYQASELNSNITRFCLEQILRKGWPVCVQTKSDNVLRDLEILSQMADAEVGVTVTTLDPETSLIIEPGAPLPQKRLDALKVLVEAGIRTWVFLGPIIPSINDSCSDIRELLGVIKEAGVGDIQYDRLRLKPLLSRRIDDNSGLDYKKIMDDIDDPEWWRIVSACVETECQNLGLNVKKAF